MTKLVTKPIFWYNLAKFLSKIPLSKNGNNIPKNFKGQLLKIFVTNSSDFKLLQVTLGHNLPEKRVELEI